MTRAAEVRESCKVLMFIGEFGRLSGDHKPSARARWRTRKGPSSRQFVTVWASKTRCARLPRIVENEKRYSGHCEAAVVARSLLNPL